MNFPNIGGGSQAFNQQLFMLAQNPVIQHYTAIFSLLPENYWTFAGDLYDTVDTSNATVAAQTVDGLIDAHVNVLAQKIGLGSTGNVGIAGMQRTGTGG